MPEFEQIRWIRGRTAPSRRVAVGPGDDAAVIRMGPDAIVTVDMLLEGVHFSFQDASPRQIGRKAMNVNLSDIAAMAGVPQFAVVAVGIPKGVDETVQREIFLGLEEAAERFKTCIIGGDTNRSTSGVVLSVTMIGAPTGRGPVLRSGAQLGDVLCVTGSLGRSQLGKHLNFTPRVAEAQYLHLHYCLHAMMDLSDGLGGDLFHLLEESNVGAVVNARDIPVTESPIESDGPQGGIRSPLDHALNDGEDFELLFALPALEAEKLLAEQPFADAGLRVSRIGVCTEERDVFIRQEQGIEPFPRGGFVHSW